MQMNLMLGSATRILMRIGRFKADSFLKLEKKLDQIDWPLFLAQGTAAQVRVTVKKSALYHSDAVAQRCQRIISNKLDNDSNGLGGEAADDYEYGYIYIPTNAHGASGAY